MYRLLCDLGPFKDGTVLREGTLDSLSRITKKALKILLEKGCVAKWESPPLDILPGWSRKARAFKTVGVKTVAQLLSADAVKLAKQLKISQDALNECIKDAKEWIT